MKNTILLFLVLLPFYSVGQAATSSLERGAQLFKEKDYSAAYIEYEKAYQFFKESGKTNEMLEALFQMGKSNTHTAKWEESLSVFELLEKEAKAKNNKEMTGKAIDAQIQLLHYFMRHDETAKKAQELLDIEGLPQDLYSDAYNILGQIWSANGNPEKGFLSLQKAYQIDSILRDSASLPFSLGSMADNRELQGKYEEAIRFYLKAISTVPARDSFKFTTFYSRLGNLFLAIGNTQKAKTYLEDARILSNRYKHKSTAAKCLLYLGYVAEEENNITLAEEYYQTALAKFDTLNNPEFQFYTINSLARLDLLNNNLTAVENHLQSAEKLLEKLTVKQFRKAHINNYLEYYLKKGDLPKAKKYLDEAFTSIDDFQKIRYQIRTFRLANEYYLQQGDYKNAYLYQNKHQALKDSIFQIQKTNLLYEMEAKYQKAEQDLAIAELNVSNKEKAELLDRKNRTIIFGGLGLLALTILGGMGFYLYQIKRKTANELEEKNNIISKALADKELLLREIHHRVKNNLQVISSLLRLQSKYIKDDNALSALNEGRNRVQSMALIHQNLYQDENLMGINIKDYFENLINSLFDSYNISESRIALEMDIDPMTLDVDTVVPLGLIVNELVSNTFKHAFPENRSGAITVNLKETKDGKLKLLISDNGIGMNEIAIDTNKDSFGYKMIRAFQAKLEAEMEVTSNNGTTVEILMGDFKKVG